MFNLATSIFTTFYLSQVFVFLNDSACELIQASKTGLAGESLNSYRRQYFYS